jgi:hypothetical protein
MDGSLSPTGIVPTGIILGLLLLLLTSACDDFQIDSKILNHMETSNKIAGIQHAAANNVATLNVSLSGAGMM